MSDGITILHAAGLKIAVNQDPETAIRLADSSSILKLTDGDSTMWIRSATVTHVTTWERLPTHGGRTYQLEDGNRRQRAKRQPAQQ